MAAHQTSLPLGFSRQEHWSGLPFPSPMHESEKWKWSYWVMSNSQRPHGLQPTRLLRPWDFPCKSTGVGCYWLLLEVLKVFHTFWRYECVHTLMGAQLLHSCPTLSDPMDCSLTGSSIHGSFHLVINRYTLGHSWAHLFLWSHGCFLSYSGLVVELQQRSYCHWGQDIYYLAFHRKHLLNWRVYSEHSLRNIHWLLIV